MVHLHKLPLKYYHATFAMDITLIRSFTVFVSEGNQETNMLIISDYVFSAEMCINRPLGHPLNASICLNMFQ